MKAENISPVSSPRDGPVRPEGHIAVKIVHAALAAGHGGGQSLLRDGLPCLLFDEGHHLPQLAGHIVYRLLGGLVGHVHHELGHPEVLRQPGGR